MDNADQVHSKFLTGCVWIIAVAIFIGTWTEIALSMGVMGIVLGWLPAIFLSFFFLMALGTIK